MNPVLLGTGTALCWGTLDLWAGSMSRVIGAARTTAGVTIAGAILLTLWLLAFGTFPSLAHPQVWLPAIAGVGFAIATLWLFAAIASGPVSLAVPLTMSYPASAILVAAIFLGSVPTLAQLLCIAVIMAGVVIVAISEHDTDVPAAPGRRRRTIIFALLSHVTFLASVFAGQMAAPIFGEIESVWISRLAGCAAVIPLIFMAGGSARAAPRHLALLGAMGFLDVAALCLLFAAGQTSDPALATVCASASGAVTVILARLFLSEPVALLRWLGIAMTFAGIATLSAFKG